VSGTPAVEERSGSGGRAISLSAAVPVVKLLPVGFEHIDQRHLRAAEGYCELGLPVEADAELDLINPEVRHVREVLAVRVSVYQALEKWELMQAVCQRLFEDNPRDVSNLLNLAYAVRRAESLEKARSILHEAERIAPGNGTVQFNLAS